MRFEHLIQITDPLDPLVPSMSRDELWRGLLKRVEAPQAFEHGPDHCDVGVPVEGDATVRQRTLHFGSMRFRDTVRLKPGRAVSFSPEPHDDQAPIGLAITIEEPHAGTLLLRFAYSSDGQPAPGEAGYWRLREQAWLENDRDMVRQLREWQGDGLL